MIAPPLPEPPFPAVFVDPPEDADDDEAPCLSLSDLLAFLPVLLLLLGLSPFPALVLEPFVVLARFLGRSLNTYMKKEQNKWCVNDL